MRVKQKSERVLQMRKGKRFFSCVVCLLQQVGVRMEKEEEERGKAETGTREHTETDKQTDTASNQAGGKITVQE